jgi:hypothetical protein
MEAHRPTPAPHFSRFETDLFKWGLRRAAVWDARMPHTSHDTPHAMPLHALQAFRAVMPGISGVVLASQEGLPLAHDVGMDASGIAAQGLVQHKVTNFHGSVPGASTFVTSGRSVYLVVFLPPDLAATWTPHPVPV